MRLSVRLVFFSICDLFFPFLLFSIKNHPNVVEEVNAPPFFCRHATRDTSGRTLNCSVPKIQEQHNNKTIKTPRRISCLVFWIWIQADMAAPDPCCFLIVASGDGHGSWKSRKPLNPSFLRSTVFLLSAPFFCSPSVGRSKMPKCSETGMKKFELGSGSTNDQTLRNIRIRIHQTLLNIRIWSPILTEYTEPDPPNLTE